MGVAHRDDGRQIFVPETPSSHRLGLGDGAVGEPIHGCCAKRVPKTAMHLFRALRGPWRLRSVLGSNSHPVYSIGRNAGKRHASHTLFRLPRPALVLGRPAPFEYLTWQI